MRLGKLHDVGGALVAEINSDGVEKVAQASRLLVQLFISPLPAQPRRLRHGETDLFQTGGENSRQRVNPLCDIFQPFRPMINCIH